MLVPNDLSRDWKAYTQRKLRFWQAIMFYIAFYWWMAYSGRDLGFSGRMEDHWFAVARLNHRIPSPEVRVPFDVEMTPPENGLWEIAYCWHSAPVRKYSVQVAHRSTNSARMPSMLVLRTTSRTGQTFGKRFPSLNPRTALCLDGGLTRSFSLTQGAPHRFNGRPALQSKAVDSAWGVDTEGHPQALC